ncbi:MAG: Hpt domain-containing protein [Desulfovibrionaceae bacterium]
MDFQPDVLLEKVGGDLELTVELLEAYSEDAPLRLQALARAVEAEDMEEAARAAHSLKGMSGVIRAERLAELALGMEVAGRKGDPGSVRRTLEIFVPLFDQVLADVVAFMRSASRA